MGTESEQKEPDKGQLMRRDLRWLNAITTMMLEEPAICERKMFAVVEKQLARIMPKLRADFREGGVPKVMEI